MKDRSDHFPEYYYPLESAFGIPVALLGPPGAEEQARQQEERFREEVERRRQGLAEWVLEAARREEQEPDA